MLSVLRAHGLDAGPAQRPLLAGVVTGVAATLPMLAVLHAFGSLEALGSAAGGSRAAGGLACLVGMAAGGLVYGLVFQRAANDPRGGWLFGTAFGFVLWMLVPVPLLQWLTDRPVLLGAPALGLFLAFLLWGLALGLAFPVLHRPLHAGLDGRLGVGPAGEAAETGATRLLRSREAAGSGNAWRL
jgi:hypothetical protein